MGVVARGIIRGHSVMGVVARGIIRGHSVMGVVARGIIRGHSGMGVVAEPGIQKKKKLKNKKKIIKGGMAS